MESVVEGSVELAGAASPSRRRRILFVDDEPDILSGLRNVLRRHRNQWDMVFVTGGEEALTELGAGPFDVVVSDMRMPQMDGAELLERVRDGHPAVTRIILSGQMDQDVLPRALLVAHQFVRKPCPPDVLPAVIERASIMAGIAEEDELCRLAGGISRLPSLPKVYWELNRAMSRPSTTVREIAAIVERDPIVAARVLQLVNSGYYGLPRPVTGIAHAVGVLGCEILRVLVLGSTVFGTVADVGDLGGLDYGALHQHSVATARIASRLPVFSPDAQAATMAAGLLHDLGKVVLAAAFPERLSVIVKEIGSRRFHDIERGAKLSHAMIGGYLLGLWGLPEEVVDGVVHHHAPGACARDAGRFGVAGAVHVADALAGERASAAKGAGWFGASVDVAYLESVGVVHLLDEWRAMVAEVVPE